MIEKIKTEYNELTKEYDVYGVFLYGSQNYGLSTPDSDLDTKAIVIPSFSDLVHNKPISRIKNFPWGECDIKDIREMMNSYKKQNVNFIETIFTPYFFVNPKYQAFHEKLINRREEIAHFDEKKALDCFNGLMMQAKKRLTHCTENTKDEIEKYGYHRKSLMNIYKFRAMTEKYISGKPYEEVLENSDCKIYRTECFEDYAKRAEALDSEVCALIKGYDPKPKNKKLEDWINQWVENIIAVKIHEEIS